MKLRLCVSLLIVAISLWGLACKKDSPTMQPTVGPGEITWSADTVTVFSPQRGGVWYPRILELADGTLLCAYDTNVDAATTYIGVSRSTDGGGTWARFTSAFASPNASANPHLLQQEDGTIFCAFREVESDGWFSIKVAESRDGGAHWSLVGLVERNTQGLWEPFVFGLAPDLLGVAYSSESYQPEYSQVITMMASGDDGRSWSPGPIVSRHAASRDGMPGLVHLEEEDWLCFFEATDEANPFCLKWVASSDWGQSWGSRELVYRPGNPAKTASAPYVIRLTDRRLLCSFQTDEDQPADGLDHADLKVIVSEDDGETWGAPTTLYGGRFGAWWNSLIQLRDGRIIAATSTNDEGRMAVKLFFAEIETP